MKILTKISVLSLVLLCMLQAQGADRQPGPAGAMVPLQIGANGPVIPVPEALARKSNLIASMLDDIPDSDEPVQLLDPSVKEDMLARLIDLLHAVNAQMSEQELRARIVREFPSFEQLFQAFRASCYLGIPALENAIGRELAEVHTNAVQSLSDQGLYPGYTRLLMQYVEAVLAMPVIRDVMTLLPARTPETQLAEVLVQLRDHLVPMLQRLPGGDRLVAAFNAAHACSVATDAPRLGILRALAQEIADRNLCIMWRAIAMELPGSTVRPAADAGAVEIRAWMNDPANQGTLAALRSLYLRGNQLTALPVEIGNLAVLQSLNLADNQLAVLPAEIGNLRALRSLNLNNNQLTVLPAQIGNLGALQRLCLSNNQLTVLPAEIGNLGALRDLDLYGNQLTVLPAEIGNLGALQTLWLNNNQLTVLPAEIGRLAALRELHLSNNQLTVLSAQIGNLAVVADVQTRMRRRPMYELYIGPQRTVIANRTLMRNVITGLAVGAGAYALWRVMHR